MHQKVKARVDSTYTASAHSANTLESWYDQNHAVGNLALSSQVLFPLFITVYVTLFLFFILELKPYNLSKKLQNGLDSNDSDVRAKADSSLLTKFVASTLFHLFTLSLDITALDYYNYLSKEIKDYYSYPPRRFWAIPITMTVFDSITFVTFICLPPLVVACCCKKQSYLLIYSLISPLSCIASHSYHIVFAFIIDPYHATSILLVYAIIAFVHILTFQKLFYYINTLISGVCRCCHIKNRCGRYCLTIIIFALEFTLMAASIALSITLIMMLPFSNALDDAPNHLYVIYQASVAFFAALIAFQVLFRQTNSAFDVFIKAIDGDLAKSDHGNELKNPAEDHIKTWRELSETEKETVLAKVVLSHLYKGVNFTEEINLVFQQKDSSPKSIAGGCRECFSWCCEKKEKQQSNGSSAQPNAGGHSSRLKKEEEETDSDSNAVGCFSHCCKNKEKERSDHSSQQDDHSSKAKKKDQQGDSDSDSPRSNAGGCFSCCCRQPSKSLLEEEGS